MSDMYTADFWDNRYREKPAIWSGNPNPQLVTEAAALAPGRALDAGCGEGADAIWLAERGWAVTAVDVSSVALARGAERAGQLGGDLAGRISWQQADLLTWEPEPQRFDLVSAQFLQLPASLRGPLFTRLAGGVAVGGTLLVVGHSVADLRTTVSRPQYPEIFYSAAEVAGLLDPSHWTVRVAEARPRQVRDQDGREVTIYDEVMTAVRE